MDRENIYVNKEGIEATVSDGKHREVIGGMWHEIGQLQIDFIKLAGLKEHHKFIDIGCGSLRGGVMFSDYLNENCYYGMDVSKSLIDAGYNKELIPLNLDKKVPRHNFFVSDDFNFETVPVQFDFAIAFSLFTHLTLNSIRMCLEKLLPVMVDGGELYATVFETTNTMKTHEPVNQGIGGIITSGYQDPYHYSQADMTYIGSSSGWQVSWIGEFDHPRQQKMVCFKKKPPNPKPI